MLTIEELVLQYEKHSDKELYLMLIQIDDYSDEAKNALNIVLKRRGGIEEIKSRLEKQAAKDNEIRKIENEAERLRKGGTDPELIKKLLTSEILTSEEMQEIIEGKIYVVELEKEDVSIKSRTWIGSFIGGAIGGTIGGVLWGLQMVYSGRIFYIFFIGLVLLCYYIIKAFTKQSKKNKVVFAATVISSIYALLLGFLLYQIVGYRS